MATSSERRNLRRVAAAFGVACTTLIDYAQATDKSEAADIVEEAFVELADKLFDFAEED